ncbi:hypothetical protein LMJ38_35125 [Streptomyces sp. R1]|uniref:hypothetical protein n=1 Tax=Streptomyces TaxID=1883 RepID=UPI00052AB7E3|nr:MULTISPECIES: hypothetical protein [unclassified Streptomyces]AIV33449.1 hypothetical protein NI25_08035 [Streptomyces sp. CCM_MD2014]MCC8341124.1 hypothetical protein [Streptomyces sp. R1]MDA4889209.1 hypothetical protein [Streptomyces sp. MS2A]MYS49129.1 hypothetical protein [Streptomyces sp. SID6013]
MKKLLEFLGFVTVLQGVMGLVHEFAEWNVGLVRRIAFLDGYEVYASVALLALGGALFAAAESRKSG